MPLPEIFAAAPPGSLGSTGTSRAMICSPAVPPQLGAFAGRRREGSWGGWGGVGGGRGWIGLVSGGGIAAGQVTSGFVWRSSATSGRSEGDMVRWEVAQRHGCGGSCPSPAPVTGRLGEVRLAAAAPRGWVEVVVTRDGARCTSFPALGALQRRAAGVRGRWQMQLAVLGGLPRSSACLRCSLTMLVPRVCGSSRLVPRFLCWKLRCLAETISFLSSVENKRRKALSCRSVCTSAFSLSRFGFVPLFLIFVPACSYSWKTFLLGWGIIFCFHRMHKFHGGLGKSAQAGKGLAIFVCWCKSQGGRCIHSRFSSFDVSPCPYFKEEA